MENLKVLFIDSQLGSRMEMYLDDDSKTQSIYECGLEVFLKYAVLEQVCTHYYRIGSALKSRDS